MNSLGKLLYVLDNKAGFGTLELGIKPFVIVIRKAQYVGIYGKEES